MNTSSWVNQFRLRTSNIPIRFITNTTKESTETLHKTLRRIGFELDLEEIYSSLSAARDYVIKKELRPLYLLTTDACNGFPQTDDGHHNAVVVGLAPEMFNYETMNRAFKWAFKYPDSCTVIQPTSFPSFSAFY